MKIDENSHRNRNINHKIKRQKAIEQELSQKFIRIDPDKDDLDIFKAINEIFRYIKQSSNKWTKQSTKKILIDKISMRLLRLGFKSDNVIKSKTIKYILKKILPDYAKILRLC